MANTIVKPDLPSSVLHFVGERVLVVNPNLNDTVAVMAPHVWGPMPADQEMKPYTSLAAWEADYGRSDSAGRTAVVGAFDGGGTADEGGAGGVIFVRLATSGAAKATKIITNTTPATALTLSAVWKGTDGNNISYITDADPVDAAKRRLRILYKGAVVETYSYATTDVTALATAINGRPSKYVTAVANISGVALTAGTASFTSGNDGSSLTTTEYSVGQDVLEFQDFGAVAAAALEDVPTKVQLATWRLAQENEMRPFRLVIGGAASESVDDVITELNGNAILRDPNVIRMGVGQWHDDLLDLDLSTAQIAPRAAGVLVARGERSALTRAKFARLTPVGNSGPTTDDLRVGRDAGVTMLRRVSSATTKVAVSQGVTTFISTTTASRPYELFSEPRIMGLLNRIVRQIVVWGDETVIGDLPVTDDTRNLVRKEVRKILDDLETTGLAKPGTGWVVVVDPEDPLLADAIPYSFGFVPTRTANYLIGEGRVL